MAVTITSAMPQMVSYGFDDKSAGQTVRNIQPSPDHCPIFLIMGPNRIRPGMRSPSSRVVAHVYHVKSVQKNVQRAFIRFGSLTSGCPTPRQRLLGGESTTAGSRRWRSG